MQLYFLELIIINFLITFLILTESACPNQCSGHGTCAGGNVCQCFTGFNGGAADCSLRECPKGTAWADKAYATDKAHESAECSNAGICNRITGSCKCFDGYTGNACQRSTCPNDCSGRGTCMTINDVAVFEGPPYDPTTTYFGDGRGAGYTYWDKSSVTLCNCDVGFFGPDCSLAMCAKGDDPLTIDQNYRAFSLDVYTSVSNFVGTLGIQFMGGTATFSLTIPSSDNCIEALEDSLLFQYVGCVYSKISQTHIKYEITIYSWPIYPQENNLHTHDGNPPITDFYCDTSATDAVACIFDDITTNNIREYVYCSNRGLCDFSVGLCTCDEGFGGPACSNITYTYSTSSNALPGLQVTVKELEYSGTALEVTSSKSAAPDFYFMEATANNEQMFYIRGDGLVGINKLNTLQGGHTISSGGLYILSGGATIIGNSLNVYTGTYADGEVATFESSSTISLNSSYSVVKILSESTSVVHYLLTASNQAKTRFAVRADGLVNIYQGGLIVTGGVTINSRGLKVANGGITVVNNGIYVQAGGVNILSGGFSLTGGLNIYTGGIQVTSGGFQLIAGGATIYSGGLKVSGGGLSLSTSGASITGGLSINTNGIRVTGGLSVNSYGLYIRTQGATIANGGLVVTGGITANDIGMYSNAGLTVAANGALIQAGLTVSSLGIASTDGLTVYSGGVYVAQQGATIAGGGLLVNNGITISNAGLYAKTGLTVFSNGIQLTGGLTVSSLGAIISGGLSVESNGLYVLIQGATIASGGLVVTGGFTANDVGIYSKAGLSVVGGAQISNGVTVSSNGLAVTGGLSVFNVGATIVGGITTPGSVYIGGKMTVDSLYVVSGLTIYNTPTSYSFVSDRRLKTDIVPVTGAMKKISKLKGVYYSWIKDSPPQMKLDNRRHVGLLAQDVQDVVPEAVDEIYDGKYLGVDYISLVPLIIAALNELKESSWNSTTITKSYQDSLECHDRISLLEEQMKSMMKEMQSLKNEILVLREDRATLKI